ncbi:hypothetical protein C8Q76DRAFT_425203 [Earliella scabrosa]|nr:hypothetical protein C8Q76DRAFT_425203 [Earliella scabrosa]
MSLYEPGAGQGLHVLQRRRSAVSGFLRRLEDRGMVIRRAAEDQIRADETGRQAEDRVRQEEKRREEQTRQEEDVRPHEEEPVQQDEERLSEREEETCEEQQRRREEEAREEAEFLQLWEEQEAALREDEAERQAMAAQEWEEEQFLRFLVEQETTRKVAEVAPRSKELERQLIAAQRWEEEQYAAAERRRQVYLNDLQKRREAARCKVLDESQASEAEALVLGGVSSGTTVEN